MLNIWSRSARLWNTFLELTRMSLATRLTAYLSTLPMSVPSRLALWLGIALIGWGYIQNVPPATVAGMVLVMVGTALWIWFRPKGGGWKTLVGLPARRLQGTPRSWAGFKRALTRTPEDKEAANAAVARAQQDPRLQAKRTNTTPRDR